MPELPEVETTRRGIAPHLVDHAVDRLLVHEPRLRWPVPEAIHQLEGHRIDSVRRRGKYLLIDTEPGTAIVHLGMSGSLRIADPDSERRRHDHVEWQLSTGMRLRYHDPRRFGCLLWQARHDPIHPLLASLGPEPLSGIFNAPYLHAATRKRRLAIKNLIMHSQVVVGVGNIYASEALFLAGIRPGRAAQSLRRRESALLTSSIKQVLSSAIEAGGTTLRDFVNSRGEPGYFAQSLYVYGRNGELCRRCENPVIQRVIGQRSSFYCRHCQR